MSGSRLALCGARVVRRGSVAGLLLLLFVCAGKRARSVSVDATARLSEVLAAGAANDTAGGGAPYYNSVSVSDFFLFDDSISGISVSPTSSHTLFSSAGQTSRLYFNVDGLTKITGYGYGRALHEVTEDPEPGGGYAQGNSFFDIFFDVTVDSRDYTLTADLSATGSALAEVRLIHHTMFGPTTVHLFSLTGTDPPPLSPLSASGTLPYGSYELKMVGHAEPGAPGAAASDGTFNVTFVIPEPTAFVLGLLGLSIVALGASARRRRDSARSRCAPSFRAET